MPQRIEPFYLSAMDPGLDTGLSLFEITEKHYSLLSYQIVRYDPESHSTPLSVLKEWKERHIGQPHVLVYENFHVRPGQPDVETSALNVIGGVQHWIMDDDPYDKVVTYEPLQGKHFATDDVLRNAGLWAAHDHDHRHVRDANRHAVTYLHSIRHMGLCRAAWPPSR